MPTIIDSLIVSLDLDASGFNQDAAKSEKKAKTTAKNIAKSGKEAQQFFTGMRNEALKLFAVLAGGRGLQQFITSLNDTSAALGFLAKNTGTSTQALNAWGNSIAALSGGSAAAAESTIKGITKAIAEMKMTGTTGTLGTARFLGVNIGDISDPIEQLDRYADALNRVQKEQGRPMAVTLGEQLGIDEGTLNAILDSTDAIKDEINWQKKHNLVTKDSALQARKLNTEVTHGKQELEGYGRELLTKVTPYLMQFFKLLEQGMTWAEAHRDTIGQIFTAIAGALTVYLIPAIAAFVAGISPATVAFAALSAAVGLLWEDFETWKKDPGHAQIDWASVIEGVHFVIDVFEAMKKIVTDVIGLLGMLFDKMQAVAKVMLGGTKAWDWIGEKVAKAVSIVSPEARNAVKINEGEKAKGEKMEALQDLIAKGETGTTSERGYSMINRGSGFKGTQKDDLTGMTVQQVMDLQAKHTADTKAGKKGTGIFAAGRYQIIPETMQRAVKASGVDPNAKFDKETQDKLFKSILPKDAQDYISGKHDDSTKATESIAKVWASVGAPSRGGGTSYYDQAGVNKAHVSAAEAAEALKNAKNAPANQGMAQAQAKPGNKTGAGDTANNATTTIGTIVINSQATDAKGIAKDIGSEVKTTMTQQANVGQN